LRFFRLVMDEAQQVQGSTAKAAEMARKIQARHRWAVTGAYRQLCAHTLLHSSSGCTVVPKGARLTSEPVEFFALPCFGAG
jgi:hypothetical protein